ncbi:AsmA family protein [Thermodesulfobacteriota bacterium]
MQRRDKQLITAGALLALAALMYVAVPLAARAILHKQLTKALNRRVTIERLSINPVRLSATIHNLSIDEPGSDARFLSCSSAHVNLEIMSLFKRGIILSEIRLEKPSLSLIRSDRHTYNISDLLAPGGKQAEPPAAPLRFSLNNIQIIDGSVHFHDLPQEAQHTASSIQLQIPMVSNFNYYLDSYVLPSFSASINGKPLRLTGKTKPFADSRETVFNVDIRNLDLAAHDNFLKYASCGRAWL